jgi:AcrR family transcriptional regulator
MARLGRRPGKGDTRADIVAAARVCYADQGYDRASIRGIARRAGVDPALVHHYFDGKPPLFVEVLKLAGPAAVEEADESARPGQGAELLRAFLLLWEPLDPLAGAAFVNAVQAASASPAAANGLREFLVDRVWAHVGRQDDPADRALRRALVASQLIGVAWDRYLLRLEPFVSATIDEIALWVGPTLDRYLHGSLPESAPARPPSSTLPTTEEAWSP